MRSLEVVAAEPEGRSLRLWRVVLSLAVPPDLQQAEAGEPAVPGLSENLVFEFDEAYTAFVDGFSVLPNDAQMLALQAVDTKFGDMVGAKDESLWTERARREDAVWDDVRSLAKRVLLEFGWPMNHA